jgi:diphthine-ammonia ligase
LAEALDLPLFREKICGKPKSIDFDYIYDTQDEVEDLYQLLKNVKQWNPEIEGKNDKEEFNFNIFSSGVSVGAINSTYQKNRVEAVCQRLGLTPLCYLWELDQLELFDAMV